jgi:hypothetical protein
MTSKSSHDTTLPFFLLTLHSSTELHSKFLIMFWIQDTFQGLLHLVDALEYSLFFPCHISPDLKILAFLSPWTSILAFEESQIV